MQTTLFFLAFVAVYCMTKLWALNLAHYACKCWVSYAVHIFVLDFCPQASILGFIYRPLLLFFLFLGFTYKPYYACLLSSWAITQRATLFLWHGCFLNAKHRRLFRFREDGEYWARVITAGFNK